MTLRLSAVFLAAALMACSGEAAKPTSSTPDLAAPASANNAETKCLATADAVREKKANEPDSVTVRHVLVKHAGSKNPKDGVTRTRGQACLRAIEARDKLIAGASFDDVVAAYSDEPGATTRGGSLGEVRRADLLAPFAAAAFELDRGQMSDVVETDFGFHIILRSE